MSIKSLAFEKSDVYIDYPFEKVMFHWQKSERKVFRKFYGGAEAEVPESNKLFTEAVCSGREISAMRYGKGG